MTKLQVFLCLSSLTLLTACGGGGGGGGGGTSATLQYFKRISAVTVPGTVRATGVSVESTYTANSSAVTSVSTPVDSTNSSVDLTYNSSGLLNKIVITTPTSTKTLDSAAGAQFGTLIGSSGVIGAAQSANLQDFAAYPYQPSSLGWDYQTFGIWETGRGTGSGTAGAISVGATTSSASMPTTGTATYSGYSGGAYVNSSGADFLTRSTVTMSTDFANRTIAFSTGSTVRVSTSALTTPINDSNLNLSGNLSWSAGSSAFNGTISTTGGMTTVVNGNFYGPSAVEAGGVFYGRAATGVESYIGAFGANR
jgi:hypothetical protein